MKASRVRAGQILLVMASALAGGAEGVHQEVVTGWSESLHGIRVGLRSEQRSNGQVVVEVKSADPNVRGIRPTALFFTLPLPVRLKLVSSQGVQIAETRLAKRLARPLHPTKRYSREWRRFRQIGLPGPESVQVGTIDLRRCFKVKDFGDYELQVELQLYKARNAYYPSGTALPELVSYGVPFIELQPVVMPPVSLRLRLSPPGGADTNLAERYGLWYWLGAVAVGAGIGALVLLERAARRKRSNGPLSM